MSKLKAELECHRLHAAATLAEVGRLLEEADSAINRHRGSLRRRETRPWPRKPALHGVWKALAEFGDGLEAGIAPATALETDAKREGGLPLGRAQGSIGSSI